MRGDKTLRYRSIADMADLIRRSLHRIPTDVDLVVGVPRSGILPAVTIALLLNLRYADLDAFLDGRLPGTGSTKPGTRLIGDAGTARHVLVVDDSVSRGDAMRKVRERLARAGVTAKVTLAAIYVVPDGTDEVDIAFELVPLPRIFEWNALHHVYLDRACVSFEGVLCRLPSDAERASEARFSRFLDDAVPLLRPTSRLACVIADLPEYFRAHIAAWLARHDIAHQRLELLPESRPEHETADALTAKARIYRAGKEILLIEADPADAAAIADLSGKPVPSVEGQRIVNPAAWSGTTAIQKLRGLRSHAQMSDSPLLNRHALKRNCAGCCRLRSTEWRSGWCARCKGKAAISGSPRSARRYPARNPPNETAKARRRSAREAILKQCQRIAGEGCHIGYPVIAGRFDQAGVLRARPCQRRDAAPRRRAAGVCRSADRATFGQPPLRPEIVADRARLKQGIVLARPAHALVGLARERKQNVARAQGIDHPAAHKKVERARHSQQRGRDKASCRSIRHRDLLAACPQQGSDAQGLRR